MANWCMNSEVITGPKEEIVNLYGLLQKWTSSNFEKDWDEPSWLGNIVGFAGLKRSDEDPEHGYRCRGNIVNDFEIEEDDDEATIYFSSQTAWCPMPAMWYAVVKKFAPHCEYFYTSEEPGMQIYESNDVDHRFFDEEYVVEAFYNDEKAVPEKIKKYFPESSYDYRNKEIVTALQDILESKETDSDKLIAKFNDKFADAGLYINKIRYERTGC